MLNCNTDMIYERLISALGGGLGGLFVGIKSHLLGVVLFVTTGEVLKTALFAAIGAIIGLTIRELWKFIKDKYFIKKTK